MPEQSLPSKESDFVNPRNVGLELPTKLSGEIPILPCVQHKFGCHDSNNNQGICSGELKKIPTKEVAEILCAAWPVDPASTFAKISSLSNQKIAYIFASSLHSPNCGEIMRMFAHLHPERFAEAMLFLKEPPEQIAKRGIENQGQTGFSILKFLHPEQREQVLNQIAKKDKSYATAIKEYDWSLKDKTDQTPFTYIQGKVSPKSDFVLMKNGYVELHPEIENIKYINQNEYLVHVASPTDKNNNLLATNLSRDSIVLCLQIPSHETGMMFHFSPECNPLDTLHELKSILTTAEININDDSVITLFGGTKGSKASERLVHFIRQGLSDIGVESYQENTLLSESIEQSTLTLNLSPHFLGEQIKFYSNKVPATVSDASYDFPWKLDKLKCSGNNLYSLPSPESDCKVSEVDAKAAKQVIQFIENKSFFDIVCNKKGAEDAVSTLDNLKNFPDLLKAIKENWHLLKQDQFSDDILGFLEKSIVEEPKKEQLKNLGAMIRSAKIIWTDLRTYHLGTKEEQEKIKENIERRRQEKREGEQPKTLQSPPVLKV